MIGIFLVDCNVEDSRGNFEANPPQVLIDPNEDDADDPDLQVVEESEAKWARVNGFLPSFPPSISLLSIQSLSLSLSLSKASLESSDEIAKRGKEEGRVCLSANIPIRRCRAIPMPSSLSCHTLDAISHF